MIKRVLIVPLALAFPVWLLAGCGPGTAAKSSATTVSTATSSTTASGNTSTTGSGGTATTAAKPLTPTTPAQATIQLTDKDNGRTITVPKGTTIQVVLSSTSWSFPVAPNTAVLQQLGDAMTAPAPPGACLPGEGCGTVSVTYKAVGSGQAKISAARTSCGEARTCTGSEGSYSVVVNVAA